MRRSGLKLGGRIDRYIASLFVSSYATAFMLVVGLFLILDMASNLDEYLEAWPDGGRVPVGLIGKFYVLSIPFLFLQVAPFVTLVAGLFTVAKLLKYNETIAMLASGISAHRVLMPVFAGAITTALMMFGLREGLAATLADKRDAYKYILDHKQFDQVYEDIRLRDLRGHEIKLKEFRPAVGWPPVAEVRGLEITSLTVSNTTTADRAIYAPVDGRPAWKLENGLRSEVEGEKRTWTLDLLDDVEFTPEQALSEHRAAGAPLDLSFSEAMRLAERDPDNVQFQTILQHHLTFPLANLVLMLVGLPIMLRHDPTRRAEGLAAGSILCVFYFCSNFISTNMGLQGTLDPKLSAWLPVLFFGSVGLVLYDSMRS